MQQQMISVDESSNGHEVTLLTGQALKITLYENPSTGFRWILPNEPNFLRQSRDEADAPKGPPGQGGVRTFFF